MRRIRRRRLRFGDQGLNLSITDVCRIGGAPYHRSGRRCQDRAQGRVKTTTLGRQYRAARPILRIHPWASRIRRTVCRL
jgi:hypothetical protein